MRALIGLILVGASCATCSASNFWITSSPNSGAPGPSVARISAPPDSDGSVHIWARPDPGTTLTNISLNLRSTDPGILEFQDITVHNPQVVDPGAPGATRPRYQFVHDSSTQLATSGTGDLVAGIQGFSLVAAPDPQVGPVGLGIGPAGAQDDPDNDAWLFASVGYRTTSLGTTSLFLQIGSNGISTLSDDTAQQQVVFGAPTDAALRAGAIVDNRGTVIAPSQRGEDSQSAEAIVTVEVPRMAADFSGDGRVDQRDFMRWQASFGEPGSREAGDADGNGRIDGHDFLAWQREYDARPTLIDALHHVPEPTSLWLVTALVWAMTGARLRWRR